MTFAAVASLAAVGGGWVVQANQWGRWLALALMLVFGLALLLPSVAERLTRPFVALGNRLSTSLRAATAGPARRCCSASRPACSGRRVRARSSGLILTGAALRGANVETSLLLLAFAAGPRYRLRPRCCSAARFSPRMKRSLGAEEWIRRALGGAVVVGAVAIAFGLDTGFLARVSTASTTRIEQALFGRLMPEPAQPSTDDDAAAGARDGGQRRDDVRQCGYDRRRCDDRRRMMSARGAAGALPVEGVMPPLDGATAMAQLGAADARRAARQGRARRLLDVLLHQLHARDAVRQGVAREVSRPGSRRHRRALAGVRVREGLAQRAARSSTISASRIPSPSTTTTRSGARSRISTGRRTTSSMPRATSATRTSAKASTTSPSASSSNCSPKPAQPACRRSGRRPNGEGAALAPDSSAC